MLIYDEIQDLARTVAALPPDRERTVADAVATIRAESARVEEERIADLRSMSDLQVAILMQVQDFQDEAVLTLLSEAGFVRAAHLETAYRKGYGRAGYDGGGTLEIPSEDDAEYITARSFDLDTLTKGA